MQKRKIFQWGGYGMLTLLCLLTAAYWGISANADSRVFERIEDVPQHSVALVLGTSPSLKNGRMNYYFKYRIDAAAALYHAGKVKHFLVSGDNHDRRYNEPAYMRAALIRKGIPTSAITLDFAGFRTLDSVVRCKEIFGQSEVIVVSQQFHNERAIFLADAFGLSAIGFNARDVSLGYDSKTKLREVLARLKAVLDVTILQTQPKFLGKQEHIIVSKSS